MERDQNYNSFLKLNLKEYNDKWVAIIDGKVITAKDSFKEAYSDAKKLFPKKRPLFAKIPSKKVMIL